MSATILFVSDSLTSRLNIGAYDRPFSGIGVEFHPLCIPPGHSDITLHETGFQPANKDWNFPGVFSPFWRLYFNSDRGHCVMFGDQMTELTPNHIMLIPPHCLFHCLGRNPVAHFWITFSFARRLIPEMQIPVLLPPRDTELCLIRDLKRWVALGQDAQSYYALYLNSQALLQVVIARAELHWQPPIPDNFLRINSYITSHIQCKLDSPMLAKMAGLSLAGFNRLFRRYFGTSPARYVTETRVREAARLLLQSNETIDSIADKTGFPNRAYFSRIFKTVTDLPPAEFRRRHSLLD